MAYFWLRFRIVSTDGGYEAIGAQDTRCHPMKHRFTRGVFRVFIPHSQDLVPSIALDFQRPRLY